MYLHHPQEINLGQLTAFFLYVNRFFSPIQLLVQQYSTFRQRPGARCSRCAGSWRPSPPS